MSGLPPQSKEKLYTADDVQHMVAREVARQRMEDMERQLGTLTATLNKTVTEFNLKLDSINKNIIVNTDKLFLEFREDRKDLRDEIEREFASQKELIRLEGKVDKIWLKVSVPVGVIVAIGGFIQYIVMIAPVLAKIAKLTGGD